MVDSILFSRCGDEVLGFNEQSMCQVSGRNNAGDEAWVFGAKGRRMRSGDVEPKMVRDRLRPGPSTGCHWTTDSEAQLQTRGLTNQATR